jgi:8-oxo-dGTP pyrophosphatase MutT (NUDIX family)
VPISEYIRRLRERVGTELLVIPSAAVLVRDESRRVLLVRHADLGMWQLPGGAVEPDESPAEAAAREALEETGLEVETGRVLGAFGGAPFHLEYPNGDRVAYVPVVFEGRVVGGRARPDGVETADVRWFEPAEVSGLRLTPGVREALVRLLD